MSKITLTLSELATRICEAEHRDDTPRLANQLRGMADRGVLTPIVETRAPKAAKRFPEIELYRARILLAAVNAGTESGNLAKVNAHMARQLPGAIEAARAGESANWVLEITRIVQWLTGDLGLYIGWMVDGRRLGMLEADPMAPDTESFGGTIESAVQIPVSSLIRRLIAVEQGE